MPFCFQKEWSILGTKKRAVRKAALNFLLHDSNCAAVARMPY